MVGSAAFAACSLNPQPLPPDTNDAGKGGLDASFAPDGMGGGIDSGSDSETTNGDGAPPLVDAEADATDANEDASDASTTDANEDASDASEGDASESDAGSSDANEEG